MNKYFVVLNFTKKFKEVNTKKYFKSKKLKLINLNPFSKSLLDYIINKCNEQKIDIYIVQNLHV